MHALLADYWGALAAEQLQQAATAAAAPHQKPHDYRSLQHQLEALTAVLRPARVVQPMEQIAYDPERAAEWFAAQGVRVVSSG